MSKHQSEMVVIGGGINGAFAAYFLACAGCKVTVVERAGIGSKASGQNPGGLNPMHGTGIPGVLRDLALEAFKLHLTHWDALAELSGIEFGAKRPPRIHVALEPTDVADLERLHGLHTGIEGFSARWLERNELLALDARLEPSVLRGLWTQGSAKVIAHAYTRAVAGAAEKLGVRFETGVVTGIDGANGRAGRVLVGEMALPCDGVVLATGPWAAEAEQWLGCAIPLAPLKGELLRVRNTGAPVQHAFAWRAASAYGDGRPELWLGGNEEQAGFDCTLTEAARLLILERVKRMMPGLEIAEVTRQVAALRPMTPDDLPVIDLAPGWQNVALALGGGRKGMLYSAAMGQAAADLVTRGKTSLSIAACTATRFHRLP